MTNNKEQRRAFEEWLEREMPAGTVIGDPKWWAPRILKAAQSRHAEEREALVRKCAEIVLAEQVDYEATHDPTDLSYNVALEHAATAILALLSDSGSQG